MRTSATIAGAIGLNVLVPGCSAARPAGTTGRTAASAVNVDADSTFFATARVETFGSVHSDSVGDLWPSCWSDDDTLYTANGDGRGFGEPKHGTDIVVNRVVGAPDTGITGEALAMSGEVANVWGDPALYNRKPTGMISLDGDGDGRDELYVAVQDLKDMPCPACFNDAPNASVSKSLDHGRTWQTTAAPMFTDHRFTTIFFLDYGRSSEHVRVLGAEGAGYVYAYGLDYNWRSPTDPQRPRPTDLYLARVPRDRILNRDAWEFYAGSTSGDAPSWIRDIDGKTAVLHDERTVYPALQCGGRPGDDVATNVGVISQGGVVYNAPLKRYIYTSWTWYTWEFYEAPQPWGPWRLFMRKDFGAGKWFGAPADTACSDRNEGGYAATIPSRFISADGKTMWVQSNTNDRWNYACGRDNYSFSFRKLEVEPFVASEPTNQPDPANNLAVIGEGVTPIEKCARHGRVTCYNDGDKERSESSLDCDQLKPLDFWGYVWKRRYNFDRVIYTTGQTDEDGGWFDDLRVQVRQDFRWIDVAVRRITPPYPHNASAGPNRAYTTDFNRTWGDGIRIIGAPGGAARFTTIAELEVYYANQED